MAYAGICGVENLQVFSDATFHAASIAQIDSFTKGEGSCYARIPANPANPNDPLVNAIANRTIPADTAFVLAGFAGDADMDPLTYQWDQLDAGCPTDARSFGTDTGFNSLFRSYLPLDTAKRHFPALGTQILGLFDDAEVIPCNNREINLRLTARDGRSGQDTADVQVSVRDTGGKFEITNLDTKQTIDTGSSFPVTWQVAGTDQAPISCSNVGIELLTIAADGSTYSVHPLLTTPNNGSASVDIIPASNSHPRARIRVKCSDNIFYDISDADLKIDGTASGAGVFNDDGNRSFYNKNNTTNGTTGLFAPVCGAIARCSVAPEDSDSGGGGSALDYRWLLLLAGLLLIAARRASRV